MVPSDGESDSPAFLPGEGHRDSREPAGAPGSLRSRGPRDRAAGLRCSSGAGLSTAKVGASVVVAEVLKFKCRLVFPGWGQGDLQLVHMKAKSEKPSSKGFMTPCSRWR